MTKRKEVGKNEKAKQLNQTAHQQAMTDPKVQQILSTLGDSWADLSPQQLGEQLNTLIRLKCSRRGIARELGKKESNIRRYMAQANSPEADSSWIAGMQRTLAKGTQYTKENER